VSYVLARQAPDGSWPYGGASFHHWIDSFHTGFVLDALDVYERITADIAATAAIEQGARFWAENFFGPDGEPFYYLNRKFPLDTHTAAQAVLTFLRLRERFPEYRGRASRVGRWMVDNLFDARGFFHYQVRRTHRVRIPYMRWSQAWAVRALSELIRSADSGLPED
jgi:hypothetical protein